MSERIRWSTFLLSLAALFLGGCQQIPDDYPREPSAALPPAMESPVGERFQEWFKREDGKSGFQRLGTGTEALGARLALIDAARSSIDMQYFLIKPDMAGSLFAEHLLQAADRGVRIRFLLDDIFTTASDEQLAILDVHPNIEVRLFNPLNRGFNRWSSFFLHQGRYNRRMHNKSFTVDNVVTIVGGRNIADEYYDIPEEMGFVDFDMIGVGPVAADVSASFDDFWNSDLSYPLEVFLSPEEMEAVPEFKPMEEARFYYSRAVDSPILAELKASDEALIPGQARVISDPPEKLQNRKDAGLDLLKTQLKEALEGAEHEIQIITPYFVPGKKGVEFLTGLRERGIRVSVLTNSLASNNHAHVHGGYAHRREPLLKAGVRLYEVKYDSGPINDAGENLGLTLHVKMFLIDRKTIFFGSLNYDPRSLVLNSEMGVLLDSPRLAEAILATVEQAIPKYTYSVTLDEDEDLVWTYRGTDPPLVLDSEPDSSWWRRFQAYLARILPVEGQL